MRTKSIICISIFAAFLALLSSCTDQQEVFSRDNTITLTAMMEQPDTKTTVVSETLVYWEPGDEIAVFSGSSTGEFTTDLSVPSSTASFTGVLSGSSASDTLWAVYPYSQNATFDEASRTITTILPSKQIARAGSFGKDMNLAVAHTTNDHLQFYNVGGGVCFTVKEPGIKGILFENSGEGYISGKIRIGFSGDIPVVEEVIEGSRAISVSLPDEAAFEQGVWYYFTAIPGQLQDGFFMRFYKDDSYAGKVFSKDVTIMRSTFGRLDEADDGASYVTEEEVGSAADAVADVVMQCVTDAMDAGTLLENNRQQIEALDMVESVEIGDAAASIVLTTGETLIYPYNYASAFDVEDEEEVEDEDEDAVATKSSDTGLDSYFFDADVYIFNLFSDDSGRKTQNKLMADVKYIFQTAGKTVCYLGIDNFRASFVQRAVNNNKIIFFSTLGSDDGELICIGEKDTGKIFNEDFDAFACQKSKFVVCEFGKEYEGEMHRGIRVKELLKNYNGPLVYFASCNTMKKYWGGEYTNKHIVGWTGVNLIGQAYAPIIADYMATWNKTSKAFRKDFAKDGSSISDPFVNTTKLFELGSGWVPLADSEHKDKGRTEKNRKMIISNPYPGTCTKSTKNYTVDLQYNNPGNIVTDGQNDIYEDGNTYSLSFDSFSGKYFNSKNLRVKDNKLSYTGKSFAPGVWRISTICTLAENGISYYHDWTYLILSKKFKANDGEEIDDIPTPAVETLLASVESNGVFLAGDVINRTIDGLETGFRYYKFSEQDLHQTLSHNDSLALILNGGQNIASAGEYQGYFGAMLRDLEDGGRYEVMAYATDEYGRTAYGGLLTFSASADTLIGASREIRYTSSDGKIVTPYTSVCDANVISNHYSDGQGVITFDGPVTKINDYAFFTCGTLTSITIPEGVTSIGCASFYDCSELASISIPKGVTSIGEGDSLYGTFERCSSLVSITIPEGVTHITYRTFETCLNLSSISIPEGVTSIGAWAFWECMNLRSITLPQTLKSIEEEAFLSDFFSAITIPAGVTSIADGAFSNCNRMTSIKILAPIPPAGGSGMFDSYDSYGDTNNCPIYVPAGSVDAYKAAPFWNQYADRIKPIGGGAFDGDDTYWVDLGLSVKWAKSNLGAQYPEDYGDYFAWGEITPDKHSFSWETYQWCNGDENSMTKYCYGDGKTVLDKEDDPAFDRTGGNWRMPTEAEWRELVENCSWSYSNPLGMDGMYARSNVPGYEDAEIFFPFAGKKDGTELTNFWSNGYYWTSSLSPFFSLGCIGVPTPDIGYLERYIGLQIRPVYVNSQ